MESNILNQLSKQMQIAPEFVVREYWEMVLLQELTESAIGEKLVFKGGTALRLAYNSPRFSVDLDFSLCSGLEMKDISLIIDKIIAKYPQIKIKDRIEKYYTYFTLLLFTEPNLAKNFSIKIEISKRDFVEKNIYEPKLLVSPVISQQILLNTYTLEQIKKEKLDAIKTRRQPRDLFDLWFINSLERGVWRVPENDYTKMELKNELNKFLPKKFYPVIEQLYYESK